MSRIFKALMRQGLLVDGDGDVYRVRRRDDPSGLAAEVLLPRGFPLEGKALQQLMNFASVSHPAGGAVCKACATPDIHPGDEVPVGAVVCTTPDLVIPQAIGTDINCGMRLHVADLDLAEFEAKRAQLVAALRGDLLLGSRDLPMSGRSMSSIFASGALGWVEATRHDPLGLLAKSDFGQLEDELGRVHELGSGNGDVLEAPPGLVVAPDDVIRDPNLATVGGGNHFVEFQVVDDVADRRRAFEWGIRVGQVAIMIHTGSRGVGVHVGRHWADRARTLWPSTTRYPESKIFALYGTEAHAYMRAMHTAANYAFVNRLLIAEMVRLRMRELFGDLALPLVYDVPHNVVFREGGLNVHRKGATPAHAGQPVLIPGSMGHPSFVLEGLGCERFAASASHGAGRAIDRFSMGRRDPAALGLDGVHCVTLREERLIEEAPAAYKEIGPVVDVQVEAGIATPVARLRPLMTFKA
jgi:tRNA-splicing ligase RtcB